MNEKYTGKVDWFNPKAGYGFVNWTKDGTKQEDMFVHFSDLAMDGFKTLKKGQTIEFGLGVNKHGQPKAVDVVIIDG